MQTLTFLEEISITIMSEKKILLVEDDETLRGAIESFLKRLHFQVKSFNNVEMALKELGDDFDVVLSDVMMPGMSGYDLLKFIRTKFPQIPLILMTAFGSIEKAVDAMKNGAYDFLVKPFSLNVLETAINAALLDRQTIVKHDKPAIDDGVLFQSSVTSRVGLKKVSERFFTKNSRMLEIIENLKRVASSKATVLIQGESGTGKELIARMIHEFSPRLDRIFVAINCAAMPDTLLESELFGHEKGSFTGAVARQIGKFELSNNGTILLDEISEMSLGMQTKLLRVLQECEIYRVGGVKPIPLNLRVIATTNRDLYQYMKEGNFREDLFYRLNVIPITMPPLRERGEDVLMLAQEFIEEFSVLHARTPLVIDEGVRQILLTHPWHGNIRELRNAMERAVLVGDFEVLEEGGNNSSKIDIALQDGEGIQILPGMTLNDVEKRAIMATLDHCAGNRTKTAQVLGISLRTLRNKLKSYNVAPDL